jgi:hypothetical protein
MIIDMDIDMDMISDIGQLRYWVRPIPILHGTKPLD